jgi:hypothetical protein
MGRAIAPRPRARFPRPLGGHSRHRPRNDTRQRETPASGLPRGLPIPLPLRPPLSPPRPPLTPGARRLDRLDGRAAQPARAHFRPRPRNCVLAI